MKKTMEVEVAVERAANAPERTFRIRQRLDGAVRAGVALGTAVLVCSAPVVAYAFVPDRFVIDEGVDAQVASPTAAVAAPNFGAQSEYEAYIASVTPGQSAVVRSYAAPVMLDKSERIYLAEGANRAPSSAIEESAYAMGNAEALHQLDVLRALPVIEVAASPAKSTLAGSGSVVDASVYAEGYTWYVDPDVLRTAVVPVHTEGNPGYSYSGNPQLAEVAVTNKPVGAGEIPPVRIGAENEARTPSASEMAVANIAPSSAATSNAYTEGKSVTLLPAAFNKSKPVVVTPGMYAEGYDWQVDPVALGKQVVGAATASSGADGYNWSADPEVLLAQNAPFPQNAPLAAAPSIGPNKVGAYPYSSPHYPDELRPAEVHAAALNAPATSNAFAGSVAAEAQLHELYQRGFISKEIRDAEGSAYSIVVPPAAPPEIQAPVAPASGRVRIIDGKYAVPLPYGGYMMYE